MNKHRFCLSIVPLALAMLFIVGCTKEKEDDKVPGLQLFEESMGGNAKVLVQNGDLLHNKWIVDENIGFFGSSFYEGTVAQHDALSFYVAYEPKVNFVSWYPREATYCAAGDAPNDPTNGDSVIITLSPALTMGKIHYNGFGTSVKFPMVAFGNSSSKSLMFRHVTGAITFWLKNKTGETQQIKRMKVVATHSDNTEMYLWTSRNINESVYGNGLVCRRDNTISYYTTPNGSNSTNIARFDFSSSNGDYCPIINDDSVLITVPIPVTSTAANFEISFWCSTDETGMIRSRTIKNVTIARNKLYDFKTYEL